MKRALTVIYFNIAFACFLLVGIEALAQVAYYLKYGFPAYRSEQVWLAAHRKLFVHHPYLVGTLRKGVRVRLDRVVVTTTEIGTRWTGSASGATNTIKIAVLGGSTTFGTGVTDTETFPAHLQSILGDRYTVLNYGVPGYSTAEAIIQLALVLPEHRPDIVILYEGWNDIRNYHYPGVEGDYYSHGMMQYENLALPVVREPLTLYAHLAQVSATIRFAQKFKALFADRRESPPTGSEGSHRTPDPNVDAIYLRNLKTLKMLSRNLGARVLFVPQVLNLSEFRGKTGSRKWSPHIVDDAMPALLKQFNSQMMDACQPHETDCSVLREVLTEKWVPQDFIDDGHFSAQGGAKFARLIANRLQELSWLTKR